MQTGIDIKSMTPGNELLIAAMPALESTLATAAGIFTDAADIEPPENKEVIKAVKAVNKALEKKQEKAADIEEQIRATKTAITNAVNQRASVNHVYQREKYDRMTAHIKQMHRDVDSLNAQRAEILAEILPPAEYKKIIFALVYEMEKEASRRALEIMQHIERIAELTAEDSNERLYINESLLTLQREFDADAYKDVKNEYSGDSYDPLLERFQFEASNEMNEMNDYLNKSQTVEKIKEKAEKITAGEEAAK